MKNWNTDLQILRKHPEKYRVWQLTQMINYGLDGKKLSLSQVRKYWGEIENKIDPTKKKLLAYYLWNRNPF
ncbi:hypothetical protein KKB83_04460 [Patescibacteria group bacterium]|nr:hypothetical protein [Patescibacteria group bacterium]